MEWRFRILNNGLLGGVVFLNAETFSRPAVHMKGVIDLDGESLFNSIKPAGGFGLRVLTNPASRINLRLDFGFGVDSFGFYMGAGEAF